MGAAVSSGRRDGAMRSRMAGGVAMRTVHAGRMMRRSAHGSTGTDAQGERRLLLAVLEDAVRTMLKHTGATRGRPGTLLREALAWVASDARDDCFRFARICEALDIDAERLRGRVLARVRASARPGQLH
ncbi:MAG: hypothetical protein KIT14_25595 [bacterium]|nr:hypothetical protein [bacterium]